jgi:hypothetical protein
MTHLGDGSFGRATGARIHARTIADCVCKDNRIIHEWLVRDQAAIALQIGSTPRALAQQWLAQRGGWNKPVAGPAPAATCRMSAANRWPRPMPRASRPCCGARATPRVYDDAAHLIGPGRTFLVWACGDRGNSGAGSHPHSGHAVRRSSIWCCSRMPRAAAGRTGWRCVCRAQAVHEPMTLDDQRFGKGTGRPVELLGIVHAELLRGRVLRQWVLLDEVALWMQILDASN